LRVDVIPAALGTAGLAASLVIAGAYRQTIFPGNVLTDRGLGPPLLAGTKVPLLPAWGFALIEVLSVSSFVVLLMRRGRMWRPKALGGAGAYLVIASLTQLAAILVYGQVYDRYYLAVAAPLAP